MIGSFQMTDFFALSTSLSEAKQLDLVIAFCSNDNCGSHKSLASYDAKGCSNFSALDVAAWRGK